MADESTATTTHHDEHDDGAHAHEHIHMPPNSWVPVSLTLALTMVFVGLLVGPAVWVPGAVWTVAALVAWFIAARNEYNELPD